MAITQKDLYAARIFLYSALPLLKVIATDEEKYAAKFSGKSFIFQVSVAIPEDEREFVAKTVPVDAAKGVIATHFVVEDGVWTSHVGEAAENPDVEFAFSTVKKFVLFFTGKALVSALPAMRGIFSHFGVFLSVLLTLLRMAGLLQAKDAPAKLEDQVMLTKLYFYLLPGGISQLNKVGYEPFRNFTSTSPDRAYAYSVAGYPELQSYLRIRKGKSKAGRGAYKRCKAFLTMRFDSPIHALDILMQKGDMLTYMRNGWMAVEGAPEFGATLGDLMMQVGYFAQGGYLDEAE